MIWYFMVSQRSFKGALVGKESRFSWNSQTLYVRLSRGNTYLSWLQPLGREPLEEPFCEQEEQEDFLGAGCHMFTPWSISSKATAQQESPYQYRCYYHYHSQVKPDAIPKDLDIKAHFCK